MPIYLPIISFVQEEFGAVKINLETNNNIKMSTILFYISQPTQHVHALMNSLIQILPHILHHLWKPPTIPCNILISSMCSKSQICNSIKAFILFIWIFIVEFNIKCTHVHEWGVNKTHGRSVDRCNVAQYAILNNTEPKNGITSKNKLLIIILQYNKEIEITWVIVSIDLTCKYLAFCSRESN